MNCMWLDSIRIWTYNRKWLSFPFVGSWRWSFMTRLCENEGHSYDWIYSILIHRARKSYTEWGVSAYLGVRYVPRFSRTKPPACQNCQNRQFWRTPWFRNQQELRTMFLIERSSNLSWMINPRIFWFHLERKRLIKRFNRLFWKCNAHWACSPFHLSRAAFKRLLGQIGIKFWSLSSRRCQQRLQNTGDWGWFQQRGQIKYRIW